MQVPGSGSGIADFEKPYLAEELVVESVEALFEYLRDILYASDTAKLNKDSLHEHFFKLGQGMTLLAQWLSECKEFTAALAKGDLQTQPPPSQNIIAGPMKSLHTSLRHLTWQAQQVAKGDYSQHVDYLGDFATAFNLMVSQLSERQQKLLDEVEISTRNAQALESSNRLLTSIMRYIPQQIFVIDASDQEILHMSEMASDEYSQNPDYLSDLLKLLTKKDDTGQRASSEIQITKGGDEKVLSVRSYTLQWGERNAEALIIFDVTTERNKLRHLEQQAYTDELTGLYNRFRGMSILNEWLDKKIPFSLAFLDLDSLKYVNDTFGHSDGDRYILTAAEHFSRFPEGTICCRIGGDEFMILFPDLGHGKARRHLVIFQEQLRLAKTHLSDEDFSYNASYGLIAVYSNTNATSGQVLHIADERMYVNKREGKKARIDEKNQKQKKA